MGCCSIIRETKIRSEFFAYDIFEKEYHMKRRIHKSMVFCLVLVMLAVFCTGCGKAPAKTESTQPTIQPTVESTETLETNAEENAFTETTEAADTPAQKAMLLYAQLLEAYPAILDQDVEILGDLSFGYDDNMARFGKHYDYFAVLDLNQDGIPELIAYTIVNHGWTPVSVFQYEESENEVQLLQDPLDPESHATFECMSTAGGAYRFYICKDNHLHSSWSGDTPIGFQEENHAYVLTSDGLAVVDCAISSNTGDESDILIYLWDVMGMNDEATRNSVFANQ